ncbi:eCIS core domain-containing protein [Undibacterium hunanense]|nr:DUF4157 domain-containing protein [Undibacterium hunanense]
MQHHALQRQQVQPPVQRQAGHAADGHASASNNTGMPDNLKAGVENLSGMAMDDVKVHYNSAQPAAMQAHAFAQGTDIHIAPGQEQHLPHEAWHVVQQKQGRVRPTFQMKSGSSINDDVGLESEADVMGARALGAGTAVVKSEVGQDGGVAQAMMTSARPVFQLARRTGILGKNKTAIVFNSASGAADRPISEAAWEGAAKADCNDGDNIDYEWEEKGGISKIYGKFVEVIDEKKASSAIKATSLTLDSDAKKHIWDRHVPRGIFAAKEIKTAYVGHNVAIFEDMGILAFNKFMVAECAAAADYTWVNEGKSKMRGTHGNIEMICTDMDGKKFAINTCYPNNKKVSKTVLQAALAKPRFADFLTALGKY